MKILYVTTSTELGGAERMLAVLTLQASQNHTVRVLCLRPAGEVAAQLREKGIEVVSLNITGKTWPGRIVKQIQKQLDAFSPDLVHAMLYWAIELTRIACAGRKIKLITTPHFDFSKRPFYQRIFDFLLKGRDDLTVSESYCNAQYLVKHLKYPKEKVYLLPNGADPAVYFKDDSVRAAMRKAHGFTPENVVFIQVSRLEPVKNPLLLLQSFRNVARSCEAARLVFVGEGSERGALENFISESGLTDKVILAGQQQDINKWLNMADVFVLPSNEESLPLALLEAQQVGLPCVVSRVGDMPLRVQHGENGFVFPPGDITLLSCFLAELAAQPQLRQAQGLKSQSKQTETTDVYSHYQHLYKQIITGEFSREIPPSGRNRNCGCGMAGDGPKQE